MKTSAAALLSLLTLASALPAQNVEKREPGDVLLCTGENYTGDCETINVPLPEPYYLSCIQVPAPFYKNVGSLKVDEFAYCRITYTEETCTAHGDAFVFPDAPIADLHHFQHWDGTIVDAGSNITSIQCQMCTNCPGAAI